MPWAYRKTKPERKLSRLSEAAVGRGLPEKLTNESLVWQDGVGDKPTLGAPMGFVSVEKVRQR